MMKHRMITLRMVIPILFCAPFSALSEKAVGAKEFQIDSRRAEWKIRRVIDISAVWSGHPVGFCLVTCGDRQYVAFYDEERRMTVGARRRGADKFQLVRLPEKVGWDSHNYIEMAIDSRGHIHLSGNVHCHPLKYLRTTRPHDITTFKRIDRMVGEQEQRVTYPRFFQGPEGELVFIYRDGGSGRGNRYLNVYDLKTKSWRRLLDTPLSDGLKSDMNIYPAARRPILGPDGYFHLCWVWRDTPDCETTHDLSYARSKDLIHWETADGEPVSLPITFDTPGLVVDPVPVSGGMLGVRAGFDSKKRLIASYLKYDTDGKTQLFNARLEEGHWQIRQATNWDYRWDFGGRGAIATDITFSGVSAPLAGKLVQSYHHAKHGSGVWEVDEATLRHIALIPRSTGRPEHLEKSESSFPGMEARWAESVGDANSPGVRYFLRWETLPAHRDRPRKPPLPEPTMLRLYEFRIQELE